MLGLVSEGEKDALDRALRIQLALSNGAPGRRLGSDPENRQPRGAGRGGELAVVGGHHQLGVGV